MWIPCRGHSYYYYFTWIFRLHRCDVEEKQKLREVDLPLLQQCTKYWFAVVLNNKKILAKNNNLFVPTRPCHLSKWCHQSLCWPSTWMLWIQRLGVSADWSDCRNIERTERRLWEDQIQSCSGRDGQGRGAQGVFQHRSYEMLLGFITSNLSQSEGEFFLGDEPSFADLV